jgi:hypothetical protein
MIDDPVENASESRMKLNSLVDHRMSSSASRDRSTPIWAAMYANSATTSRLAVASTELSIGAPSPSSWAIGRGSRPSAPPATAPAP